MEARGASGTVSDPAFPRSEKCVGNTIELASDIETGYANYKSQFYLLHNAIKMGLFCFQKARKEAKTGYLFLGGV